MRVWVKIKEWIGSWGKKEESVALAVPQHYPVRRNVDTNAIRARINGIGWSLKEIPIMKSSLDKDVREIRQWKIIAFKGIKSIEANGNTIDEAMSNMGQFLGVIPRK